MLENNVKALCLHLVIAFCMFLVAKELAFPQKTNVCIIATVIGILISIFYVFLGYTIMEPTESVIKDFISVFSVFIIGIIIWYICYSSTNYGDTSVTYDKFNGLIWVFYIIFIYPAVLLTTPIQIIMAGNEELYIFFSIFLAIIPSLLFGIGILFREVKNESRKSKKSDST